MAKFCQKLQRQRQTIQLQTVNIFLCFCFGALPGVLSQSVGSLLQGQDSVQFQSNSQNAYTSPYVVNPPVEIVPYYNENSYEDYQQQRPFAVKNAQTPSHPYHNVQPLYFRTNHNAAPTQTENPLPTIIRSQEFQQFGQLQQQQPQRLQQQPQQPNLLQQQQPQQIQQQQPQQVLQPQQPQQVLQQQQQPQGFQQQRIPDSYNPSYNFPGSDISANLVIPFNSNNNIVPTPTVSVSSQYINPGQPAGVPIFQNPNENLITNQNQYYRYQNQNEILPVLRQNQNTPQTVAPVQTQTQYGTVNNNNNVPTNNFFIPHNLAVTAAPYTTIGFFQDPTVTNIPSNTNYFTSNNNNNNNNIVNSGFQFGPSSFSTSPSTNFGHGGVNSQHYQQFTLDSFAPSGSGSSPYGFSSSGSSGEQGFGFSASSGPSGFPQSASSNTATVIETFKALDKTHDFLPLTRNLNSIDASHNKQSPTTTTTTTTTTAPFIYRFSPLFSNANSNSYNIRNNNVVSKGKHVDQKITNTKANHGNNTITTTTTSSQSHVVNNNNNDSKNKDNKIKEIYSTKILVSSNIASKSKPVNTSTPKDTAIKTTTESIVFGRRLKSKRNRNKTLFSTNSDDDGSLTTTVSP